MDRLLAGLRGIPDVAMFLVAGVLLGAGGFGLLRIDPASTLNQLALTFGACFILFDGGASLRLAVLKQTWITIVVLSTIGVLVTAAITGLAAQHVLGIPWIVALLLAAVIASTDPATLIPVFQQVKVRERVAQTVMAESAFNDATGAILTFAVLGVATGRSEFSFAAAMMDFATQVGFGLFAGAVLGHAASLVIANERWTFMARYAPVVTIMAMIGAYLFATGLDASGFMAVFVFGIVMGNRESYQDQLTRFVARTSLAARALIFVLLGAQVDLSLVSAHLAGGAAVVAIFMLVARPAAVFACALPDRKARWTMKELLFMCWTRETGVIPGALAGLLMGMNAPQSGLIASVAFIAILATILLQATTTRWLAGRLGLLED
ncbi:MAG TPA: cation:proton antiporter [Usitatibacter sp.]|nr:cation:proton antiporter [Usitatibacter sp.]